MAYKIAHHRLLSDYVQHESSEKNSGTFATGLPDTIVFHFTATGSLQAAVNELLDSEVKASAHLVIGRNGSVVQLMPFDRIAWHAGVSEYQGRKDLNRYSIGIELENAGRLMKSGDQYLAWFGRTYGEDEVVQATHPQESEPGYWHRYTEPQISTLMEVCRLLCSHYRITALVGHDTVSLDNKMDPGPAFPLSVIREKLLHHDRKEGIDKLSPLARTGTLYQNDSRLLREPHDTSPAVSLTEIAPGTAVSVTGENRDFYRVSVPVEGWLRKENIKLENEQLQLQEVIDV